MTYCPHCGNETQREITPEEQAMRDSVRIAEINAERDVAIARLNARMQREVNETVEEVAETEADAQVAAATVEAEVVGAAIEAAAVDEPEPIIIEDAAPEEPENEMAPPTVDSEEHHESRKRVGLGLW